MGVHPRLKGVLMSCNHKKHKWWKRGSKVSVALFIAHLFVHEVPLILLGGWALTESCHHHHNHKG